MHKQDGGPRAADDGPTETPTAEGDDRQTDGLNEGVADRAEDVEEDVNDESAKARSEIEALNDRHLRLAAEFDNYRKRTERERAEAWTRSQADLTSTLLDVLDDLQRVSDLDPSSATVQSVLEGVEMVERKLLRVLTAAGLEEVETEGRRFDPSAMEALMTVEAERPEQDDEVAGVLQKGYRMKGHLLRPARVQVRKHGG